VTLPVVDGPHAETRDMYTIHGMFRREFALLPEWFAALARAMRHGGIVMPPVPRGKNPGSGEANVA